MTTQEIIEKAFDTLNNRPAGTAVYPETVALKDGSSFDGVFAAVSGSLTDPSLTFMIPKGTNNEIRLLKASEIESF